MRYVRVFLLALIVSGSIPRLARAQDPAAPTPEDTLRRALTERKLKVKFDSTPVDEVLDVLRDLAGVNIAVVASSTIDKKVTLKGTNVSARSVLDAIAAADDGFSHEVWRGFVFVSSKTT